MKKFSKEMEWVCIEKYSIGRKTNREKTLTQRMFGGASEVPVNGSQTLLHRIVAFLERKKH